MAKPITEEEVDEMVDVMVSPIKNRRVRRGRVPRRVVPGLGPQLRPRKRPVR